MTGASGQRILVLLFGLAAVAAAGCADLDILPYWVPFQGPISDKLPGVPTPAERIVELRSLSERAAKSGPEEKQRIAQELVDSIRTEKDPLIRTEIIRTLGSYSGSASDAVLKASLGDTDSKVRIAACEAWAKRGDAQAVALLAEVLQSDVDSDVRLAAARSLGETKNSEAVAALGEALNDSNPAMQYRAVLSLSKVTGKNLGNDVNRWQQYVKGELPEPTPSLAEQIRSLF